MLRPEAPASGWRRALPLGLAAATLGGVAVLFAGAYLLDPHAAPLGWDSPFYVWRTRAVGVDGLDRIGTIRSAGPLLFAAMARASGRNVMTIAAIGPAVIAGVAAAAAGGVARAALRVRAGWIPVFGLLVWSAFGRPGMVREQPDNALNAALVLAALAAALARAESGRGTTAVFALLVAAGLAHWPFYALAAAAFALGIAWWGRMELRARLRRDDGAEGSAGPLLVAVGASGAAVAASFLGAARGVWRGPRLSELSEVLRGRFFRRVGELQRYPSVVLAGAGALAAAREPAPPVPPRARGLFLSISGAWVLLVLGGVLAQAAGIPTAGIRLLNYLFPVTLLTGVFVWWAARRLSAGGSAAGRAGAAAVVVLAVAGFGALAWPGQLRGEPWYEPEAVAQIAAAGGALEEAVAGGELDPAAAVRFPIQIPERPNDRLTLERWRNTVLAILPPERAAHAVVVVTGAGDPLGLGDGTLEFTRPTVVIRRYNPEGFELARAADPGRAIDAGVAFAGSLRVDPSEEAPEPPAVQAGARSVVPALAILGALLFVLGGGWAAALLPADTVLRAALAPAFGVTSVALGGVGWDLAGLPLGGAWALVPGAAVAAAGWVLAFRGNDSGGDG